MDTKVAALVSDEKGLLDRHIFVDEEIYKQELEQVFGRCWLFVGHESLISKPNDFIAQYMGEDPILVTRDARGKLHTFLNMCRHRGNRICRADFGNAPSFMCTYHGWTFSTDGKLVGVPGYKEAYFEELDRSQWGLVEARTETYKGLIYATWDKSAPTLLNYLGDMAWYLDLALDRRSGGTELLGGIHRWTLNANWKFCADNFHGDGYHVPITHSSASALSITSNRSRSIARDTSSHSVNVNGHGLMAVQSGPGQAFQVNSQDERLREYNSSHLKELEERLGAVRAWSAGGHIATVFPTMSYLFSRYMIRVWHPRGPEKTEVWAYCIVDKDAPPEVKRSMRLNHIKGFGPTGNLEQDDMNNWLQCTATAKSRVGRLHPMNVQLGLGHDVTSEDLPGSLSEVSPSENNQRVFYQRWAEIMDAPSWAGIRIDPMTKH